LHKRLKCFISNIGIKGDKTKVKIDFSFGIQWSLSEWINQK